MKTNDRNAARTFLQEQSIPCQDLDLLATALTHPSYAQESNLVTNNQRLEFLGDAVLSFVVAEYLYTHYPQQAEGELTKIRARVVCEPALSKVAGQLKLGKYLLLGKGEEKSGGRNRQSILADAVEAVIGAVYLDQGFETARKFILENLEEDIRKTEAGDHYDYKSRLQELVQGKNRENVTYSILEETGPAHDRTFVAGVFYQDRLLATGEGHSKKEAQQCAASKVLNDKQLLNTIISEKMNG
jgi:ribonuclease-3